MKEKNRKKDWIFIVGLLVISMGLYVFTKSEQKETGTEIVITVDGKEYGRYPIEKNQDILVKNERGTNRIKIKDGIVWMEEADCPDKYCVSKGKIKKTKQTIVCLPHKLVVEVVNNQEKQTDDADIIAK